VLEVLKSSRRCLARGWAPFHGSVSILLLAALALSTPRIEDTAAAPTKSGRIHGG